MFLANDPWVGAAHQQDVMLICPVFHHDQLFCWVTNCLHQYDIGGITPSSFCMAAENAYEEGILIPPVKIIEAGHIRRDIEELYLRASRKPEAVALDFRAQLAGNTTAKTRIETLLKRYGPKLVKAVMRKILDDGERAFLEKMARLPDGSWRDRTYVECSRPGDRKTHRVQLTLHKRGNSLIFENEGTAEQDGAMNATFSGWRGSIMVAFNQLLCWDQYFAIGGALRHVVFDPSPGTMNCANFPASVSTAPVQAMEISLYPAYNVLSKMIYCDPIMRQDIMCIGGTSQWPATIFRGQDQWGDSYGYLLVDPIGGAIGAFIAILLIVSKNHRCQETSLNCRASQKPWLCASKIFFKCPMTSTPSSGLPEAVSAIRLRGIRNVSAKMCLKTPPCQNKLLNPFTAWSFDAINRSMSWQQASFVSRSGSSAWLTPVDPASCVGRPSGAGFGRSQKTWQSTKSKAPRHWARTHRAQTFKAARLSASVRG
ncbi:MAG: hypothetical protein EBW55_10705 [Betaproteobacteria bacterium]|nr:hypothetical protein [Betaproteobacteria bacterium]